MPSCPSSSSSVVVRRRPSSSVVVRRRRRPSSTFHLKSLFLRNCLITFSSSLAWSFITKVPIYCENVDLVESS